MALYSLYTNYIVCWRLKWISGQNGFKLTCNCISFFKEYGNKSWTKEHTNQTSLMHLLFLLVVSLFPFVFSMAMCFCATPFWPPPNFTLSPLMSRIQYIAWLLSYSKIVVFFFIFVLLMCGFHRVWKCSGRWNLGKWPIILLIFHWQKKVLIFEWTSPLKSFWPEFYFKLQHKNI